MLDIHQAGLPRRRLVASAAGPALLANTSYFERRIIEWDPEKMRAS